MLLKINDTSTNQYNAIIIMEKCRACLSTEQGLVPFDNTSIESYNLLTSLTVNASDGLPQVLCDPCFNIIESFVTFRLNCIHSDEILKAECGTSTGTNGVMSNGSNNQTHDIKFEDDDDDMGADTSMGADDELLDAAEDALHLKQEDDMDADEMEESKWEDISDLPDGLVNDLEVEHAILKFEDTSESEFEDTSESESADSSDECAEEPNLNREANLVAIENQLTSVTWEAKEFPVVEYKLLQPSYRPNVTDGYLFIHYFQQYIDNEFIETIVARTNRSYLSVNRRELNLSSEEFRKFLGMTFIMAAMKNLSLKDFWGHPFGIPIIMKTMSRHRYVTIRNSIELVVENDITDEVRKMDKLWKIKPLIDRIQKGCRMQVKDQHLSLDEMIIPFTGLDPMKPYRPNHRNPIGLKAYVMSNPDGLVTDIEIFQGETLLDSSDSNFGVRENAVLAMADTLVPGHILYFDRYFTTEKLANELASRGIGCTGVLRRSRLPPNAKGKLISDEKLRKGGKGAMQSLVNDNNKIAITKWFDKKVMTFLSTVEANDPVDKYERWSSNLFKEVSVNRPIVAKNFDDYFEGSELTADILSEFPFKHLSKSCMQRFFLHMMDLAVCNSWLLYKKVEFEKGTVEKRIKEFQSFKMELGEILITGQPRVEESDEFSSSEDSSTSGDMPPLFEIKRSKWRGYS